jgi:hypothetical protein
MSTVVLTLAEHSELLTHAETIDPPRYPSRFVGDPAPVARFKARIPEHYSRLSGKPIPIGWSGTSYARDEKTGNVEIAEETVVKLTEAPGIGKSLQAKLKAVQPEPAQPGNLELPSRGR